MIEIAGREIGPHKPPYMVAEISGNHGGDLLKAVELIRAAKEVGADAAKFQLYKPEDLAVPGSQYWDIYQKCQVRREWLDILFDAADQAGITLFASVFSRRAIGELMKFDCPAYKIASPEGKEHDLINDSGLPGKPVIVSTGAWGDREKFPAPLGDILLHCVAKYPTPIEDMNLGAIAYWKSKFGPLVGLSDHTPGIIAPIAATALGAVMIEKHFKIDEDCCDAAFSLGPAEFKQMVDACRQTHAALGDGIPMPTCSPREREIAA